MAVSRSGAEFCRRHGIVDENARPAPRLSPSDLLVHFLPLESPPHPAKTVLMRYEGDPPPDRNGTKRWPVPAPSEES